MEQETITSRRSAMQELRTHLPDFLAVWDIVKSSDPDARIVQIVLDGKALRDEYAIGDRRRHT